MIHKDPLRFASLDATPLRDSRYTFQVTLAWHGIVSNITW